MTYSTNERLELIQSDSPFFGDVFAIVEGEPEAAVPETVEEIEAEIARAMSKKPERRPFRRLRGAA